MRIWWVFPSRLNPPGPRPRNAAVGSPVTCVAAARKGRASSSATKRNRRFMGRGSGPGVRRGELHLALVHPRLKGRGVHAVLVHSGDDDGFEGLEVDALPLGVGHYPGMEKRPIVGSRLGGTEKIRARASG